MTISYYSSGLKPEIIVFGNMNNSIKRSQSLKKKIINVLPNFCILRFVFIVMCVHPLNMVEVVDTSSKVAQKRLKTVFYI